ncbi:hypothetical protein P280DRAFT_186014 [Massarina eburnea CBS 473.64]|uniref:alpha,alpha-trehalase n=1 Tax=Massarina eburnea CBS 473.64 TaxID=1395130 RepID=A0A6A6SB17_9PLEO|nr:hypothetical protein P280DRAFT_186014 [Massarina eburnea CBS 473.64]
MRRPRFFGAALVLLTAFRTIHATNIFKFNDTEWDEDHWILRTHVLAPGQYQNRISLANGYFGINLAAVGPFFEIDNGTSGDTSSGWPLFDTRQTFGTIAGFYGIQNETSGSNYAWLNQYGWESFISGVPHWSGLLVECEGELLNANTSPDHISNFATSLEVEAGVMTWTYEWRPGGGASDPINIEYRMFIHKLHINQAAVQLKLTAIRDLNVTVYDVLEGTGAMRTDFVDKKFETDSPTIWTAVSPLGLPNITAYIYSTFKGDEWVDTSTRREITEGVFSSANASSIGQAVQVKLQAGQTSEISKFVGAASSDAFSDPKGTASHASVTGALAGYATLLDTHIKEWREILPRHAVDRYHYPNGSLPVDEQIHELQLLSVTNPFQILQNTVGPNAIRAAGNNTRLNVHSVPVCGLGADCYGGLIFWDAETWMALGLQVSHPEHIETVVNYRVDKYPQAKENIKMAFSSSKNETGRFTGGAVYPWTSGRDGNCTGTGPCFDYEYHLNGDIAIALRNQYVVSGDWKRFKEEFLPINNDIAYFYGEALDFNKSSGFYELWNATDPDEYANNVNNVGFTTALIQKHLNETNELNRMFGLPENETWKNIVPRMRLPVNEDVGIVLEYDTMNGSITVKQADVVLTDDILHYDNPYSIANLDYYANKQSKDGPGMTYATFSIVANEISPSGCSSFTYDIYSAHPYIRLPWFQYSEQMIDNFFTNGGTHPAFPFLTGMGGSNRIGIFGYLGLRLFVDKLDIDPSLPPQIEHLDYRTFYWQGYGINATSNATHTTLSRMPDHILSTANPDYKDHIPVTLGTRADNFALGTTSLTVPNRMIGQTPTVQNNILQCKPVIPPKSNYLPGQLPIAAVDGASSTKWQPYDASRTNYLTVDLGHTSFYPIKEVLMDWGSTPPQYYEVLFTNVSLPPFGPDADIRNITAGSVQISEPYDPSMVYVIQPVRNNQTNQSVPRDPQDGVHWSGRYAHLGIRGNMWNETAFDGATVAEWNVVRWTDEEMERIDSLLPKEGIVESAVQ